MPLGSLDINYSRREHISQTAERASKPLLGRNTPGFPDTVNALGPHTLLRQYGDLCAVPGAGWTPHSLLPHTHLSSWRRHNFWEAPTPDLLQDLKKTHSHRAWIPLSHLPFPTIRKAPLTLLENQRISRERRKEEEDRRAKTWSSLCQSSHLGRPCCKNKGRGLNLCGVGERRDRRTDGELITRDRGSPRETAIVRKREKSKRDRHRDRWRR